MLKKLIYGAGIAYLARKFMGGRRTDSRNSRTGLGSSSGRRGW